jgi:hypothetical protein
MVQFYSTLLKEERSEFIENEVRENEDMGIKVLLTDMHLIVGKMKNGKAPRPGNINSELIKHVGRKVILLVKKLINKILHGYNTPQEMKIWYVVPIHKKEENGNEGIIEVFILQI